MRFLRCGARRSAVVAAALLLSTRGAEAGISPAQVLVVYNSASADGTALKDYYLAAHPGIPAAHVFDLNNAALLTHTITYLDFVNLVRNPLRAFLDAPGPPEAADIIALALIRPVPHRIFDINFGAGTVGDNPSGTVNVFLNGNVTAASVDAELTLLWQNLSAGEAGGTMDSFADNVIVNPYFKQTNPIDSALFPRAGIKNAKTFVNVSNVAWFNGGAMPLTAGDIYLVCRVDACSLADAQAVVDRARDLYVNRAAVKVLLDEYGPCGQGDLDDDFLFNPPAADPFFGGPDYEDTRDLLVAGGWTVRHDHAFTFITPALEPGLLVGYASYGENHSANGCGENPAGDGTYIFGFRFAPGAIFNTLESYNARGLNGLPTLFNQGQICDFINAGGTFGVGNVFEPFSVFVPDNEFLYQNFLVNGRTFAEAAWSGIPALSWQQVAVGDPLARAAVINDPGLPRGDMNGDGRVDGEDIRWFESVLQTGPAAARAAFPGLDPILRGDFTGDYRVTPADVPGFVAALLGL